MVLPVRHRPVFPTPAPVIFRQEIPFFRRGREGTRPLRPSSYGPGTCPFPTREINWRIGIGSPLEAPSRAFHRQYTRLRIGGNAEFRAQSRHETVALGLESSDLLPFY